MTQPIQGARRVMETTDPDTVNQYLRFGWKLINQYVVQSRSDALPVVTYVLASIRTLEETKEVVTLTDKYVSGEIEGPRHESLHFVLAWQQEDTPVKPGSEASQVASDLARHLAVEIELDRD
jgi:hypothetical protein